MHGCHPFVRLGYITSLLLILAVSGCASRPSVTEHQCRAGDWETVGQRDGVAGRPSTKLLDHQEACGPYRIVPDKTSYLRGWRQGLASYCTAENGFALGAAGRRHNSVCHDLNNDGFTVAYQEGHRLYTAKNAVRQAQNRLNEAYAALDDLKESIVGASTAQLQPDLTARERIALVAKLKHLVEERDAVAAAIPDLEAELAAREQELASVENYLAANAY